MLTLLGISSFIIFYAMIGYPATLYLLDIIFKAKPIKKDYFTLPTVSLIIVAHNEEEVIKNKLINTTELDYPIDKFEIIVASDNSTDRTNQIVKEFASSNQKYKIKLVVTKEHKGKTNAQNEAQRSTVGEIIVMTDANSILKSNSIKELVSCFTEDNIAYVCGKLVYTNKDSLTSNSESSYWNYDLKMRDIESRFQTITAGNGALYACRKKDYMELEPIFCHDSMFPYLYALQEKRAIFNPDAIAYEKSGSNNADEFKRKIRMNRYILYWLKNGFKALNVRKYKWFSLFFFGHRFCRYCLWLAHIFAFALSVLATLKGKKLGKALTFTHLFVGIITIISLRLKLKNRLIRMIGYYVMTVFAQFVGVKNIIMGKANSVWEKAESTRGKI